MYKWTTRHLEEDPIPSDAKDCDIIGGIVTSIYDGNTFSMMVTEEDYDNEYEYEEYRNTKQFEFLMSPLPNEIHYGVEKPWRNFMQNSTVSKSFYKSMGGTSKATLSPFTKSYKNH